MKLINQILLLIIFSGCSQHKKDVQEKTRKIGIHSFTGTGVNKQSTNWYYIKDINEAAPKGYYFESEQPVEDFTHANFIYYDKVPENFMIKLRSKEKIILIDASDLPANIFNKKEELESLSVRE